MSLLFHGDGGNMDLSALEQIQEFITASNWNNSDSGWHIAFLFTLVVVINILLGIQWRGAELSMTTIHVRARKTGQYSKASPSRHSLKL